MNTKRAVILSFTGSLLITVAQGGSVLPDVPGTYELQVCKGPCDFGSSTNVVVRGVLVLTPETFTAESLNRTSRVHFERAYSIGGDPDGCFVLDTVKENRTFAGLIEFGVTLWRASSGRVMFELYASPV